MISKSKLNCSCFLHHFQRSYDDLIYYTNWMRRFQLMSSQHRFVNGCWIMSFAFGGLLVMWLFHLCVKLHGHSCCLLYVVQVLFMEYLIRLLGYVFDGVACWFVIICWWLLHVGRGMRFLWRRSRVSGIGDCTLNFCYKLKQQNKPTALVSMRIEIGSVLCQIFITMKVY